MSVLTQYPAKTQDLIETFLRFMDANPKAILPKLPMYLQSEDIHEQEYVIQSLWEAFDGHHMPLSRMFVSQLYSHPTELLQLISWMDKDQFSKRFDAKQNGNLMHWDTWDFPTPVVGPRNKRMPAKLLTMHAKRRTDFVNITKVGFEIPMNWVVDPTLQKVYETRVEQVSQTIRVTMDCRVQRKLMIASTTRKVEKHWLPRLPASRLDELGRLLDTQANSTFSLNKDGVGFEGLEVIGTNVLRDIGYQPECIFLTNGIMRFIRVTNPVNRLLPKIGNYSQPTVESGRDGHGPMLSFKSPQYGLDLIPSRKFPAELKEEQDPSETLVFISERFDMLPTSTECYDSLEHYKSCHRTIAIVDGDQMELRRISILDAIKKSGIFGKDGNITLDYGQKILENIIREGEGYNMGENSGFYDDGDSDDDSDDDTKTLRNDNTNNYMGWTHASQSLKDLMAMPDSLDRIGVASPAKRRRLNQVATTDKWCITLYKLYKAAGLLTRVIHLMKQKISTDEWNIFKEIPEVMCSKEKKQTSISTAVDVKHDYVHILLPITEEQFDFKLFPLVDFKIDGTDISDTSIEYTVTPLWTTPDPQNDMVWREYLKIIKQIRKNWLKAHNAPPNFGADDKWTITPDVKSFIENDSNKIMVFSKNKVIFTKIFQNQNLKNKYIVEQILMYLLISAFPERRTEIFKTALAAWKNDAVGSLDGSNSLNTKRLMGRYFNDTERSIISFSSQFGTIYEFGRLRDHRILYDPFHNFVTTVKDATVKHPDWVLLERIVASMFPLEQLSVRNRVYLEHLIRIIIVEFDVGQAYVQSRPQAIQNLFAQATTASDFVEAFVQDIDPTIKATIVDEIKTREKDCMPPASCAATAKQIQVNEIKQLLKKTIVSMRVMEFLVRNDIPIPMSFVLFRMYNTFRGGSMVFFRKNDESIVLCLNRADVLYQNDNDSYTTTVGFMVEAAPLITNPKTLHIHHNACAMQYIHGAGTSFLPMNNTGFRNFTQRPGSTHGDIIIVPVPYQFKFKTWFSSITGHMPSSLLDIPLHKRKPECLNFEFVSKKLGLVTEIRHNNFSKQGLLNPQERDQIIAIRGAQKVWKHDVLGRPGGLVDRKSGRTALGPHCSVADFNTIKGVGADLGGDGLRGSTFNRPVLGGTRLHS